MVLVQQVCARERGFINVSREHKIEKRKRKKKKKKEKGAEIPTPKQNSVLLCCPFPASTFTHTFPNTNTHFPPSQTEHPTKPLAPGFGFPRDLSSPTDSFSLPPLHQVCEIKLKPFPQIPSQFSLLFVSKQTLIPHTFNRSRLTCFHFFILCAQ
jgi:hypothetical protein